MSSQTSTKIVTKEKNLKDESNEAIIGRAAFSVMMLLYSGFEVIIKHIQKSRSSNISEQKQKHVKLDIVEIKKDGKVFMKFEDVEKEWQPKATQHVAQLFESRIINGYYDAKYNEKGILIKKALTMEQIEQKRTQETNRKISDNIYDAINNLIIELINRIIEDKSIADCKGCSKQKDKPKNKKFKYIVIPLPDGNVRMESKDIVQCGLEWLEIHHNEFKGKKGKKSTYTIQNTPETTVELIELFKKHSIQQNYTQTTGIEFNNSLNPQEQNYYNMMNQFNYNNGFNVTQERVMNDVNDALLSSIENQSFSSSNKLNGNENGNSQETSFMQSNQNYVIAPPPANQQISMECYQNNIINTNNEIQMKQEEVQNNNEQLSFEKKLCETQQENVEMTQNVFQQQFQNCIFMESLSKEELDQKYNNFIQFILSNGYIVVNADDNIYCHQQSGCCYKICWDTNRGEFAFQQIFISNVIQGYGNPLNGFQMLNVNNQQ